MTKTEQSPSVKQEVFEDSKPASQPVLRTSKVENVEGPDKKVIKLLKSQGKLSKNYNRNLPKRVKPSVRPFVHPKISTASDWESSISSD